MSIPSWWITLPNPALTSWSLSNTLDILRQMRTLIQFSLHRRLPNLLDPRPRADISNRILPSALTSQVISAFSADFPRQADFQHAKQAPDLLFKPFGRAWVVVISIWLFDWLIDLFNSFHASSLWSYRSRHIYMSCIYIPGFRSWAMNEKYAHCWTDGAPLPCQNKSHWYAS